jgi:putative ABC transport system permease protein
MSSPIDRWIRMWSRLTRRGVEREVDEELDFHLEMRVQDYEAQGMEPESAREKAMSRFGDVGRVRGEALRRERARVHRERKAFWIDATLQDVRHGARQLRKRPVFTLLALLMLALGIGANTAIFSVIHAVLLRPLPYSEPDRLVQIWETNQERGWPTVSLSEPNLLDLQERAQAFDGVAGIRWRRANLLGSGAPEELWVGETTTDFFSVLGLSPIHGRNFLPEEGDPAHENRVALLAHALWNTRFGADPQVVGTTLSLDGETFTVVGILPPRGRWETSADVFVPLVPSVDAVRANKVMRAIGRLATGTTQEVTQTDLDRVAVQLAEAYPEVNQGIGFRMAPSGMWLASTQVRQTLWILMGAVGFLLLIACVNLANLLLAQATARKREVALWVAMGAERSRIVRRVLTESLLLGLGGAGLGVLVASVSFDVLRAFEPGSIPRVGEVGLNQSVLLFTLMVALATGLVAGLVPALQAPTGDILSALREGDRSMAGGRRQHRLRSLLISVETALSLILLVGAGLLVRSSKAWNEASRPKAGSPSSSASPNRTGVQTTGSSWSPSSPESEDSPRSVPPLL